MKRENSPNEVQKWYPRGTNFFGVLYPKMEYGWQPCIKELPAYRLLRVGVLI